MSVPKFEKSTEISFWALNDYSLRHFFVKYSK